MTPVRIGTRASLLARTQTQLVADRFAKLSGLEVEIVLIESDGDRLTGPLSSLGGNGVFAAKLRQALLAGECDLVVHSLKDLPTAQYPGLTLVAVPEREDSRDALVTKTGFSFEQLPAGSKIGTGSPRRVAALKNLRSDLEILPLRGNIDSRVARVESGELDGVVLAAAGLNRIGRDSQISHLFSFEQMPSAPGQGALAVEAATERLANDPEFARLCSKLDSVSDRLAVQAERKVLAHLEAGCSAPVGAYAQFQGEQLSLRAVAYLLDGSEKFTAQIDFEIPAGADLESKITKVNQAAIVVGDELLATGAATELG